jgi:methionine synthase II (cobalamin-independent)
MSRAIPTTAIGSLPHTALEPALQFALMQAVPAAPQLPRLNPAEFMLSQAVEGFPGARAGEGRIVVDVAAFEAGRPAFVDRLDAGLAGKLAPFEPSPHVWRAWRPFLWEVEQRQLPAAKAQLAGPLTVQWATVLDDGRPLADRPDVASLLGRLVLVRALAMVKALAATGARPLFFFDEPGLYAYDKRRPGHVVDLQRLGFDLTVLRQAGASVGVHCCGQTDWAGLLSLPLDVLSLDAGLSLDGVLALPQLDAFLARGGRLALGVIPTHMWETPPVDALVASVRERLSGRLDAVRAGLMLTPACGLAMKSIPEAEDAYDALRRASVLLRA